MLSLNKLDIFARVVRSGSFSAAADQLYLSQPAVSKHIQDLEASLGTQLFERAGSRGVVPTDAGDALYAYAERILALVGEAENKITRVENITEGQITVGVTQGVGSYRFPEWLGAFSRHYPHLTVSLQTGTTSDVVQNVLRQKLHIGFVEGELDHIATAGLASLRLQDIEMLMVVGPKHLWWGRARIPAAELNGQAYIARQPASRTRTWTNGVFTRAGVQPRIVAEFDSVESIKSSIASGLGIGILPAYAIHRETELGLLHPVIVDGLDLRRALKLVWHQHTPFNPISRAFLQLLAEDYPALQDIL
jgi:LysR family transcriptional regulator, low CO2-responsive transcriptional regulator